MMLTNKVRGVLQSTICVVAIAAYAGAKILYAGVNEVGDPITSNLLALTFVVLYVVWR